MDRPTCEAPEQERAEAAADGAEQHDERVRHRVAEVPDEDLADDRRQIEQGKDVGRGQLVGKTLGESRNV